MSCKYGRSLMLLLLVSGGALYAGAATVYDEASSPDLSNSGLSPTNITVAGGSNQIFGTTGRGSAGLDRDYFTFTVPTGFDLTSLMVLPGTTSGGAISFIGLEAGNQVTLPTNAPDATGLLGWRHYSPADINTDLLPQMAVATGGSSGFSVPLEAGAYSVWIQDFNSGTFNYGFDLTLTPSASGAVPEPGTYGLSLVAIGFATVFAFQRWRPRKLRRG